MGMVHLTADPSLHFNIPSEVAEPAGFSLVHNAARAFLKLEFVKMHLASNEPCRKIDANASLDSWPLRTRSNHNWPMFALEVVVPIP